MTDRRRYVLATGNAGKLRELVAMLDDANIEVAAQSDFAVPEVEETGLAFVENAILKARNAAIHTGLPAIADDSGLEVDALNGAPGVTSARFAGPNATDEENLRLLLDELGNLPEAERAARFQCVMVLVRHPADPMPLICTGTWEGRITDVPAGDNGFGYDPVFVPEGMNCTSAQLDPKTKNRISHRGRALKVLVDLLRAGAG